MKISWEHRQIANICSPIKINSPWSWVDGSRGKVCEELPLAP